MQLTSLIYALSQKKRTSKILWMNKSEFRKQSKILNKLKP